MLGSKKRSWVVLSLIVLSILRALVLLFDEHACMLSSSRGMSYFHPSPSLAMTYD
jgi:hypothetical protein